MVPAGRGLARHATPAWPGPFVISDRRCWDNTNRLIPTGRRGVVTVATELAANAVRHTASGGQGFFAVELTWQVRPVTVRVAVADGGALPARTWNPAPTRSDPARSASGHRVPPPSASISSAAASSATPGPAGLGRDPVDADGAAQPDFTDGYEASLRDIHAVLAARYPEADIWFGRATMQWWALIGRPEKGRPEARRLLTAESPADLAQLLDVARATVQLARGRSRGRHGVTGRRGGPRTGRPAGQQTWAGVRAALGAPPRIPPVTRAVRARSEAR